MRIPYCIIVLVSFFCCIKFPCICQVPEIIWESPFGGNFDDRAQDIVQDAEGNILTVGYSDSFDGDVSFNHGLIDFWAVMQNSDGEILWEKSYGGSSYEVCSSVCLANDGGFILAGSTFSNDGDVTLNQGTTDCWVIKIDILGEIIWQKTYGGSSPDGIYSIKQISTGGYIVAAQSMSQDGDVTGVHGISEHDYWIYKIDDFGNLLWEKAYGSYNEEAPYDIIEVSTGGFLIAGYTWGDGGDVSGHHGITDYWILRIDNSGNIIWQNCFGSSGEDIAYSVVETESSNFICAGITYGDDGDVTDFHGLNDTWVIKITYEGELIWQKCYGGSNFDETHSIFDYSPNQLIFIASSSSTDGDITENIGDGDFWIVAIDTLSNLLWQKSIGGTLDDYPYKIIKSTENEVLTCGYTFSSDFDVSPSYESPNYWVVKLKLCDTKYFLDTDFDGFGNALIDSISCETPVGYVLDSTDCNDSIYFINPSVKEICNYFDDNCNGLIDEGLVYLESYADSDSDNFGNILIDTFSCELPEGYVLDNTDCDDTNADIYPGAEEFLNGLDDDCDQIADEGLSITDIVKNTISIFPNPVNNILFIQSDVTHQITIVNQLGETILFNNLFIGLNTISVENFPSGVYWVKAENEEMVVWVKE